MKTLPFITSGISLIILIISPFILTEETEKAPLKKEDTDLTISISDDSKWTLNRMDGEQVFKLDYIDKDVSVIIDHTDEVKISFIVNGNLYSSPSEYLISPIQIGKDHPELEIQIKGEEVRIYTKGGTLGDLVQMDYDKSLKMQASIEIVDQKLNIEITGLYNISSGLSVNHITCNQEKGITSYSSDDDHLLSDVEFLLINTVHGTPIYVSTGARAIQLIPDTPSGININFEEAYSMGGQESVASILIVDEEINSLNSFIN